MKMKMNPLDTVKGTVIAGVVLLVVILVIIETMA